MSREPAQFKFMAWHPSRNIMLTMVRIDWTKDSVGEYCNDSVGYGESGHHIYLKLYEVILRQFTGLYDKDRKPIYEGDVLRLEQYEFDGFNTQGDELHKDSIAPVVYEGGSFVTGNEPFKCPVEYIESESITILGNLYSNPELLK